MSDPFKDALRKAGECLHPTPETDAEAFKSRPPFYFVPADFARNLERRLAEAREENARLRSASVRLYNLGYDAGHCDTVEGCFTDIHPADMGTYHGDVVAEILQDILTP